MAVQDHFCFGEERIDDAMDQGFCGGFCSDIFTIRIALLIDHDEIRGHKIRFVHP